MSHATGHIVLGMVMLFVSLGISVATVNRRVRGKLRLSLFLFVVYLVLNILLARPEAANVEEGLTSVERLVLALGIINLLVAVAVNPLREDRVPDRFPNIVQDAITIGVFGVVATVVLQEKFWTTSAVGAAVIGFALQDTLGNMFAGLAIQVDKPFHAGQWITVGRYEGLVTEITWRATKLRTKSGNLVVVPNNVLSKDAITNFSEPALPTRMEMDIPVSYLVPPSEAEAAIREALADTKLVLRSPEPQVLMFEFGASGIIYRVRFWIIDFAADDLSKDEVRRGVYYAFKRRHIEIPWPIQVNYWRREAPRRTPERVRDQVRILSEVEIFSPLTEPDRYELASTAFERLYGDGQTIVRQGDPGSSMFVICEGRARVTIDPGGQEVARIEPGGYFGEMSLLTGEPRSATVSALGDCLVLEITAEVFRRVLMSHPAVVEQIGLAVEARRAGLERTRLEASVATAAVGESARGFLSRIQQFLRLPSR